MKMEKKKHSHILVPAIVVGSLGTYGFISHTHAPNNMTNGWAPYAVLGERLCVALVQLYFLKLFFNWFHFTFILV